MNIELLKKTIREVPDFPKKGISFKDITPVLNEPSLCAEVIEALAEKINFQKIDAIAGIESRGFLFGILLAQRLNIPFIPIRKAGKLPHKTVSTSYDLEYGEACIEMHIDAVKPGWNVIIHDDLLATGGTSVAAAHLLQSQNALVAGFLFLIDLNLPNAKNKLLTYSKQIMSLVQY